MPVNVKLWDSRNRCMGSRDQFTLQVLLKDAPVSQSGNANAAITCVSAWGMVLMINVLTSNKGTIYTPGRLRGKFSISFWTDRVLLRTCSQVWKVLIDRLLLVTLLLRGSKLPRKLPSPQYSSFHRSSALLYYAVCNLSFIDLR